MSSFLVPTYLAEEIEQMINSLWWRSNRGAGTWIDCISWDHLIMCKDHLWRYLVIHMRNSLSKACKKTTMQCLCLTVLEASSTAIIGPQGFSTDRYSWRISWTLQEWSEQILILLYQAKLIIPWHPQRYNRETQYFSWSAFPSNVGSCKHLPIILYPSCSLQRDVSFGIHHYLHLNRRQAGNKLRH